MGTDEHARGCHFFQEAIQCGAVASPFDGIDPDQHAIRLEKLRAHFLDSLVGVGRPRDFESGSAQRLGNARKARAFDLRRLPGRGLRSEEHTSELQSLMRISYAVFCLKKKNN